MPISATVKAVLASTIATLLALSIASRAHAAASVSATISVGTSPWGVAISPDGATAYVANAGADSVSVINLASSAVVATVSLPVGSAPTGIAMTPNGSTLLITGRGTNQVFRIATATLVVSTGPAGCLAPKSITMRNDGNGAYIGCLNGQIRHIATSNLASSSVANWTDPIPDIAIVPTDADIAFVVASFFPAFNLLAGYANPLSAQPLSVAIDSTGAWGYASLVNGDLSVIHVSAPQALDHTISLGGELSGIALTPDGTKAYVTDQANNVVKVVDLATRQVVQTLNVGSSPQRVAISSNGRTAVVTNAGSNTVSVIDITADAATGENVPTAALQQFARAENQTCDIAPDDLTDFPALGTAVRNDAWGASWAQWPNGGTGGFVCTRQPYYTSNGTWAVH